MEIVWQSACLTKERSERVVDLITRVISNLYRVNIGITHVFSCINICRVPRKLFEHEAVRPSV